MSRLRALLLVVVVALACVLPARAEGSLDIIRKFQSDAVELDVCTYTRDGSLVVALFGMINNADGKRISFVATSRQWPQFVELWKKARAQQKKQGSAMATVGSMVENAGDDQCDITLSVDTKSVRVAIHDPGEKLTLQFDLSARAVTDFEAAMDLLGARLKG